MKNITWIVTAGLFLLFGLSSCAPKQEMTVWFPPETGAGNLALVYVDNQKPSDPLYLHMEQALRGNLVNSKTFQLAPKISEKEMQSQLAHFNYAPRIPTYSDKEMATLKYQVELVKRINRERQTTTVTLANCNYLRKKKPCSYRPGTLINGVQRVEYTLKGEFQLLRKDGTVVIENRNASRSFNLSQMHVPDENTIARGLASNLAASFLKAIAPYKRSILVEYHSDGDSYAVSLMQNEAYTAALNRLTALTKGEDTEPADVYHMGLIFEIQGNARSALSYYENADSMMKDDKDPLIRSAIQRTQKSLGIKN
jgi:hypothetical protein